MPKQKDLERIIRPRMGKRAQVTRKEAAAQPPKPAAPDYAALAGVSDETVEAKTGKTWAQWVDELDRIGALELSHGEVAKYVLEQFEITAWWSQSVTVGYERIRGLRAIGQRRSGAFEVTKSKTFPVPVEKLHRAFAQARTRKRWLDVELTVRKSTPPKSIRMTWPDETSVELSFVDKGPAKSQLAVQHRKLSSAAEATRVKQWWAERLDALAQLLAQSR